MHKNTSLLQLSLSANTEKMNPYSDANFEPKAPDVYAHGHLPLRYQSARVRRGRTTINSSGDGMRGGMGGRGGSGGAARSRDGGDAAKAGIRTTSGRASERMSGGRSGSESEKRTNLDAVWDLFYVRICLGNEWELTYNDPLQLDDHTSKKLRSVRNPSNVLHETLKLPPGSGGLGTMSLAYMNGVCDAEVGRGTG